MLLWGSSGWAEMWNIRGTDCDEHVGGPVAGMGLVNAECWGRGQVAGRGSKVEHGTRWAQVPGEQQTIDDTTYVCVKGIDDWGQGRDGVEARDCDLSFYF